MRNNYELIAFILIFLSCFILFIWQKFKGFSFIGNMNKEELFSELKKSDKILAIICFCLFFIGFSFLLLSF